MRQWGAIWQLAFGVLLLAPAVGHTGDVEDLKATFEQAVGAVSGRNLDALMAFVHDDAVYYFPSIPFPSEGKAVIRQAYQSTFTNHESITLRPINPQYRVIGPTGMAWGHFALTRKPKDGPSATVFTRYTWNFLKVEGRWLIVTAHASPIGSGNSTGN